MSKFGWKADDIKIIKPKAAKKNYSPDQERDDDGEFGSGGGGKDTSHSDGKTSDAGYFAMKEALASKFPKQAKSKDLTVTMGPVTYTAYTSAGSSKGYQAKVPTDGSNKFTFVEGKDSENGFKVKPGGKSFTIELPKSSK